MPLRLILLILLAGFIVWLAYKTITTSRRKVAVTRIISLVALSFLLAQQGWLEYQWFSMERTLSQASKVIAGPEAEVHCQRFWEAYVYTRNNEGEVAMTEDGTPEKRATISYDACRTLREFLKTDRQNPTNEEITAIHVLTHEAFHMYGHVSEAATECFAMQLMPWVAQSLGVPKDKAEAGSQWYVENVYPNMPDQYVSPTVCKPGGAWDLEPDTKEWPRATQVPIDVPTAEELNSLS